MSSKKRYIAILLAGGVISVSCLINKDTTPSISESDSFDMEIKTNENNQTYGSKLALSNYDYDSNGTPIGLDLILVEADNGKVGYVLKEDFYDTKNQPNTPEEAIEYMKNTKTRIIPVYDKEGEDIIGEFKMGSK